MAKKTDRDDKNDRPSIIVALGRAGPYGLLGLVALVLEAALLTWFVQAGTSIERIVAGGLMAVILIGIIVAVVVIERGRLNAQMSAAVQAAQSFDRPPIPQAVVETRPNIVDDAGASRSSVPGELLSGPDRSYVIARPPEGWSIQEATMESRIREMLGIQDVSDLAELPTGSLLVLNFGERLDYSLSPDRTRINGRLVPLLLTEPLQRALRITTLPRRQPPFFVERSLYDQIVMLVVNNVGLQLGSVLSITPRKLARTNRDMVVAEMVQEFEDIRLGDRWVEKLRVDVRYYAIRGDLADYILGATNVRVGLEKDATAERMDRDVDGLFDSFQVVSVPDPKAAERAEMLRADRGFDTYIATSGGRIFEDQLQLAVRRLREMTYDTPEGIAQAMTLLRPFRIFARMLGDPALDRSYAGLWAAMDAADGADTAPLRNYLNDWLAALQHASQGPPAAMPAQTALIPPGP